MSEERIVRYSLEKLKKMKGRTDWERVDALTDEEIERAVAEDPDAELLDEEYFKQARLVVPAHERARVLFVDAEVVDHFKQMDSDYRRRMNAVLRAYVLHKKRRERHEGQRA